MRILVMIMLGINSLFAGIGNLAVKRTAASSVTASSPEHILYNPIVILAGILFLLGLRKVPQLIKGLGEGLENFKKMIKDDEEQK